ncbi:exodeoxyribonuclease VII large subunit [Halobaculum sp. MBLA0147]|uniref:exodeoxyribonuclease VII large subunit n=1 Tax=Halobaculum sp. MBLA0147 TaxID=3079934 RepID=UPI0035269CF0
MGTEREGDVSAVVDGVERLGGEVVTVTDLGEDVAALIDRAAPSFDYVVGDATDVYTSSAGHRYFDLVHDGDTLDCVAFQGRREGFTDAIEEDSRVAVAGDLTYYGPRGNVNVQVSDVVVVGEGQYDAAYEAARSELESDGLLAPAAKRSLPDHPRRVGLVTSADSDAREDAVTSLHECHPGVEVVVYDATVQGDAALPSLLGAIADADADPSVDVLVVTRGGGADTDLRVFDDLGLCRRLAEADTPTVVAVGHERDTVLAGEVADARAMTPTDVGQCVLADSRRDLLDRHARLSEALDTAYGRLATRRLDRLAESLDEAYETHTAERVGELRHEVDERFARRATSELADRRSELDAAFERRVSTGLTALRNRLDHALDTRERTHRHEAEKEAAIEEATTAVRADHETTTRRQRVLIAVLLVALLVTLALLVWSL